MAIYVFSILEMTFALFAALIFMGKLPGTVFLGQDSYDGTTIILPASKCM